MIKTFCCDGCTLYVVHCIHTHTNSQSCSCNCHFDARILKFETMYYVRWNAAAVLYHLHKTFQNDSALCTNWCTHKIHFFEFGTDTNNNNDNNNDAIISRFAVLRFMNFFEILVRRYSTNNQLNATQQTFVILHSFAQCFDKTKRKSLWPAVLFVFFSFDFLFEFMRR